MFCKSTHTMIEGLEQLGSLESHLKSDFGCNQFSKNCRMTEDHIYDSMRRYLKGTIHALNDDKIFLLLTTAQQALAHRNLQSPPRSLSPSQSSHWGSSDHPNHSQAPHPSKTPE